MLKKILNLEATVLIILLLLQVFILFIFYNTYGHERFFEISSPFRFSLVSVVSIFFYFYFSKFLIFSDFLSKFSFKKNNIDFSKSEDFICPKCKSTLIKLNKSIKCSENCGFVLFNKMLNKKLSDSDLFDLIKNGTSRKFVKGSRIILDKNYTISTSDFAKLPRHENTKMVMIAFMVSLLVFVFVLLKFFNKF